MPLPLKWKGVSLSVVEFASSITIWNLINDSNPAGPLQAPSCFCLFACFQELRICNQKDKQAMDGAGTCLQRDGIKQSLKIRPWDVRRRAWGCWRQDTGVGEVSFCGKISNVIFYVFTLYSKIFYCSEARRRQKTVKYHVLRRQMTSPGAPKRKLSWDAIEQIRWGFLSQSNHSI